MGVDTGLYLSNRWSLDDLRDVIEKHLGCPVEIKSTTNSMPDYHLFIFTYKGEKRQLNVHCAINTPLGRFTLIALGKWGHSEEILQSIGEVLGGLYYDNDYDNKMDWLTGKLDEDNNLSYHVKYAVLEHKAETLNDVAISIRQWNARIKQDGHVPSHNNDSNDLIGDSKFGLIDKK